MVALVEGLICLVHVSCLLYALKFFKEIEDDTILQ